jgi:hypothetical protein
MNLRVRKESDPALSKSSSSTAAFTFPSIYGQYSSKEIITKQAAINAFTKNMALFEIVATSITAQLVYIIVWRLFFSPIAQIPGPKLAALTSWYEFYYDVIRGGQFVWHIQELHDQYGKIIPLPAENGSH